MHTQREGDVSYTMDAANVILTALATAFANSGQAMLNDSAKEMFEHLKKRVIHAF